MFSSVLKRTKKNFTRIFKILRQYTNIFLMATKNLKKRVFIQYKYLKPKKNQIKIKVFKNIAKVLQIMNKKKKKNRIKFCKIMLIKKSVRQVHKSLG